MRVCIETRRLLLREITKNDLAAVHEYASDPEVTRYMLWGPNTEEETRLFIQRTIEAQREDPRVNFNLLAVLKVENQVIGGCGLDYSPATLEGRFGYLLNKKYWKMGYATEIANGLVNFGFETLHLHRIVATCDVENLASAHVIEKTGLVLEGCLRENVKKKDEWRNSYIYAILESEWKVNKLRNFPPSGVDRNKGGPSRT